MVNHKLGQVKRVVVAETFLQWFELRGPGNVVRPSSFHGRTDSAVLDLPHAAYWKGVGG